MSTEGFLDVKIMGREYRIACPAGQEDPLLKVVRFVDQKMSDIAARTRNSIPERVAVMAALSIAGEMLNQSNTAAATQSNEPAGLSADTSARLANLSARIDRILAE